MATKDDWKNTTIKLQSPWDDRNAVNKLTLKPEWKDEAPAITEEQLKKEMNIPQPPQTPRNPLRVPMRDVEPITPGGVNLNIPRNPIAEKHGVQEGQPSMSIYDHLLKKEEEDDEKEKARRRRDALFNAISDGLTSVSDIYFASKGAPYAGPSKSLVEANEEGYAKSKKEREDRFNKRMRLLKDQQSERYRALRQQIERDRLEQQRKNQEAIHEAQMARIEAQKKYWADKAEADKAYKEAEQKRKQQETDAKTKDYEDRIAKRKNNNVPGGTTTKKGKRNSKKNTHRGNTTPTTPKKNPVNEKKPNPMT